MGDLRYLLSRALSHTPPVDPANQADGRHPGAALIHLARFRRPFCRWSRLLRVARALSGSGSLLTTLVGALPSPGHAQATGAVTGRVTGPDGQPLSEVIVAVQGTGLAVATGAGGRYRLARVPSGPHEVEFRRIGFKPHQVAVDVTSGALTLDAVLESQPIELATVLVEGVSRAPDRTIDAPAAVDVVRPTTAEPVSLTGQTPLALARVPGLDLLQSGVNDFNVNARGFNSTLNRKLPVLIDGREVTIALTGNQSWGTFPEPIEDLGRIEVIRGPVSALYGPNAFNGVISITTPAAREIVGTKLTLGGGELATRRVDLRQAGMWLRDRLGYRLSLGYSRSDDWTRSRTARDSSDWKAEYASANSSPPTSPGPETVPLNGQTKDSVTGRALGAPDPQLTITGSARLDYYAAEGSMLTLEGGTARAENSVALTGTGRNQTRELWRPWARLGWSTGRSTVFAWYSGRAGQPNVRLSSGSLNYNHESLIHVEGRTSRQLGGETGRVIVGASVQDNRVNTEGTTLGVAYDDRSDWYYGAFAQVEHQVAAPFRLVGALRWDNSNLFPAQLTPRVAIVFTPVRDHALRLSVNRAFLTPTLANLFIAAPAGTGVQNLTTVETKLRADPVVGPALANVPAGQLFTNSAAVPDSSLGNLHLVPQSVVSYEVGYKGQFGRRVFMTMDAYGAHIKNLITPLLPTATAHLNPDYAPWTAPPEVPAASRGTVESAVRSALLAANKTRAANGLTRLADGTTAIVQSSGNVGAVDEWGVEVGGNVSLTDALSLSASYTWYNFAIRQNIPGNVLAANTPRNKGTVSLYYLGRQGIDAGVDARLVSRYRWTSGVWDGDVPASQTVNVHAAYRISPQLRVYAYGTNIFDQQRFQFYGGSVIGRRVLVGMTTTL